MVFPQMVLRKCMAQQQRKRGGRVAAQYRRTPLEIASISGDNWRAESIQRLINPVVTFSSLFPFMFLLRNLQQEDETMKLDDFLSDHHVPFERLHHRPAYTANRVAQMLHVPGKEMAKTVL